MATTAYARRALQSIAAERTGNKIKVRVKAPTSTFNSSYTNTNVTQADHDPIWDAGSMKWCTGEIIDYAYDCFCILSGKDEIHKSQMFGKEYAICEKIVISIENYDLDTITNIANGWVVIDDKGGNQEKRGLNLLNYMSGKTDKKDLEGFNTYGTGMCKNGYRCGLVGCCYFSHAPNRVIHEQQTAAQLYARIWLHKYIIGVIKCVVYGQTLKEDEIPVLPEINNEDNLENEEPVPDDLETDAPQDDTDDQTTQQVENITKDLAQIKITTYFQAAAAM